MTQGHANRIWAQLNVQRPMFFLPTTFFLAVALWLFVQLYGWRLRKRNISHRLNLLQRLGHTEPDNKQILGFFHPYWYGRQFWFHTIFSYPMPKQCWGWRRTRALDRNCPYPMHEAKRYQRGLQWRHKRDETRNSCQSEGACALSPSRVFFLKFYAMQSRFNIELDETLLDFVFLDSRRFVEDSAWPRMTLLGQSLGSMYLAWEAMSKLIPDLYIGEFDCRCVNPAGSLS